MKKLLSALLCACLLLLAGCASDTETPPVEKGTSGEHTLVGTWTGSYTYYEKEITVNLTLKEDGSYAKEYHVNGALDKTELGSYNFDTNGDLLLHAVGEEAYTRYKLENGALVNNDHPLTKVK